MKRLLITALALLTSCAQLRTPELKTTTEYYADGHLKCRYTYYLDTQGREVLHGKRETWSPLGTSGMIEDYDRGRLVRTYATEHIAD